MKHILCVIALILFSISESRSVQSAPSKKSVIQTKVGNAVYRAREIVGNYGVGIHYDDLVICNSNGYYKTSGGNSLQNELKQLQNIKSIINLNEVVVYPNPANKYINIDYVFDVDENGMFELYNNLGQKIYETILLENSSHKLIYLNSYSGGVYRYRIRTSFNKLYSGNLILE